MAKSQPRVQLYAVPELTRPLLLQLQEKFPGVDITLTNQTILPDQDLYLVSVSAYLRTAYHQDSDNLIHFKNPEFRNKLIFLKSSDNEWKDLGKMVIHRSNLDKINELLSDLVLNDSDRELVCPDI
jgi:hypothetical protein